MADQSDEIKNLFTKLGFDPSHYQQIRSTTTGTVAEPPPRRTLLQPATAAIQAASIVPTPAVMAATAAAPAPRKPEPVLDAPLMSSLSAALLGAAEDIVRAEAAAQPELDEIESAISALASAQSQVSPAAGLQSLFKSVKESQAAVYRPNSIEDAPTERPTVRLSAELLQRANAPAISADQNPSSSGVRTQTLQSPLLGQPDPHSASQLGPKPGAVSAPEGASAESLTEVFRRLARHQPS